MIELKRKGKGMRKQIWAFGIQFGRKKSGRMRKKKTRKPSAAKGTRKKILAKRRKESQKWGSYH